MKSPMLIGLSSGYFRFFSKFEGRMFKGLVLFGKSNQNKAEIPGAPLHYLSVDTFFYSGWKPLSPTISFSKTFRLQKTFEGSLSGYKLALWSADKKIISYIT